ncbi:hypothetical protein K501DRAFT_82077 [Backusella circina FSU 941]|nr:hypothetical protein K501DRAFT_82077 [Backusella circina FSU 941]
MVSIKSFITTSAVLMAAFTNVQAAVSPSYPSPGTIQTEGQQYNVTWTFDGKNSTQTYQIDFMTGSNDNQTVLANIATGVKADALSYTYTAPYVTPTSAIYFFMFTGSQGDVAWTTRFGLIPAGGNLTTEPEQTQPDAIPWGQGSLDSSASTSTVASSSSAPVSSASNSVVTPAAASSGIATVSASVNSASSAVAGVAAAAASSGSTIIKPALGFVSAAIAGYLSL